MKKLFLLLLIVLALGAWVGEKMVQDPGYVLIAYNESTIETSLWVLLVALFLGFLLAHWAVNLFFKARFPTAKLRDWRERRSAKLAQGKTLKGLLALSEGRWWKAQRLLTQSAEVSGQPLINYIAAARAAHEQREDKAADELLQQARNSVPQAELAIGITQVQIQLERGQLEPCLATLLRLRRLAPKHTYVLRLLKDVYVRLQDWQELTSLIPELRKLKVLDEQEIASLEQTCYANLLGSALAKLPVEADDDTRLKTLTKEWQSIPSGMARDESLVRNYVELLVEAGSEAKAEQFLREQIKRQWDEGLVKMYGRVQGEDAHKQLEVAKGWLKKYPESAALKLTLGRLSMRNEHWGKAADYLEESLAIEKSPEAYGELTRLLQHLGDSERSLSIMQEGLTLMGEELPSLPLPDKRPTP
ncbi:heme biosynthesis HemY N-terminal domain-containing protein [Neptunomonas concharum]|uniref:Heme biosynthesis protein HemY n=1 Tax=Neptunomonas concharum TaxID=1031538 RepID=A0A5P1REN9_9GAMM|nr:heme biosynthesis HemY N-terminal domain-containing protein [Neptunomonas concharum]QEQ98104.1 heme biosynthesis protein HemY [Neptunomonas concharum]